MHPRMFKWWRHFSRIAKKIEENAAELLATLMRLKPSSAKGTYMKSIAMSSTMGPGIKIEQKTATA